MKYIGRGPAETGAGNIRYEFTHEDELFIVNALKLAAAHYGARMDVALHEEGKATDDPDVRTLRLLELEHASRGGYLGMAFESGDYEELGTLVYQRAQQRVAGEQDPFPQPVHAVEPAGAEA